MGQRVNQDQCSPDYKESRPQQTVISKEGEGGCRSLVEGFRKDLERRHHQRQSGDRKEQSGKTAEVGQRGRAGSSQGG